MEQKEQQSSSGVSYHVLVAEGATFRLYHDNGAFEIVLQDVNEEGQPTSKIAGSEAIELRDWLNRLLPRQEPVETSAPRALAFGDEVTYAPLYDSKLPREGWKVEVLPKLTYVIKHPNGSLIAVDAGEINAVEPIATPGATLNGEPSIPSEGSRPRELLASRIESIRREVVALKRSIDPHISDPRRCEILRSDLDPIWQRLVALLDAEETKAPLARIRLKDDIYDDGADHHPPGIIAHKGDVLEVRELLSVGAAHPGASPGKAFIVRPGEFEEIRPEEPTPPSTFIARCPCCDKFLLETFVSLAALLPIKLECACGFTLEMRAPAVSEASPHE